MQTNSSQNKYEISVPFLYMWSTPMTTYHKMSWDEDIDEGYIPPPKDHFSLLPRGHLLFSPDDTYSRGHDVLLAYRVIRPFTVFVLGEGDECDSDSPHEVKCDAFFLMEDGIPTLFNVDTSKLDFIDRTQVYILSEAHISIQYHHTCQNPDMDSGFFSRALRKPWKNAESISDTRTSVPYDNNPTVVVGTELKHYWVASTERVKCDLERCEFSSNVEKILLSDCA